MATAENKICDLDTCKYEVSKKKQKEIKQQKKKEQSIWYLWHNSKPSDIQVIRVPGGEERNEQRKYRRG